MKRMLGNLGRSILYIGISTLIGYYSFQTGGFMSIATNLVFFALGILMVATWQRPTRKESALSLDALSLNEQDTGASVAEPQDTTETPISPNLDVPAPESRTIHELP